MALKKIVVIGGGTGTFTVLSGLKKIPNLDISVIVSMMDSGGSNRVIRDEFGMLPTSDIRQCILALASNNSDKTIRELFNYRYTQGTGISGMTFGNLFMAALTDILKSQKEAIDETSRILDVKGKVIPVTFDNSQLVATYDNGIQVLGEHFIDEPSKKTIYHKIVNLEEYHVITAKKLVEAVIANPALRAILQPKIEATQNFAKRLIANNRIVQQHALELEKKLREIENRREAIKLQLRTEWLGVIEKSLKQVNKMQEQVGTLNLPPNRLSPTEANLTTALLYLQEAAGFVNHDRFDIADKRITAVENILKQVEKLTQGTIVAKEAAAELNALRDLPELELKR